MGWGLGTYIHTHFANIRRRPNMGGGAKNIIPEPHCKECSGRGLFLHPPSLLSSAPCILLHFSIESTCQVPILIPQIT
jgi:hypothetical protein